MHIRATERELRVETDLVEMKKGEQSWIGPRSIRMSLQIGTGKMVAKHSSSCATRPFVEITQHDARSSKVWAIQDFGTDESPDLLAPFKERRSHVNVEQMQLRAARQCDVHPQAPARFAAGCTEVVVTGRGQRKPGNQSVSIDLSDVLAIFPKALLKSQFSGNESSVIVSVWVAGKAEHLLQRDDVCVQLAQHLHDALRPDTPSSPRHLWML